MKILLATDGSRHSEAASDVLAQRPWPDGSEVLVVSVRGADWQKEWATRAVDAAVAKLVDQAPSLDVTGQVIEGRAKEAIPETAASWGADLVVMGAHGHGPISRHIIGSVAHATVEHAPCSVEIARIPGDPAE